MIYINLLPWREQQKLESKKDFVRHSVIAGSFGAAVVALAFVAAVGVVDSQNGVNARLEQAIKVQEGKIAEIKDLKDQIQILLARKKVVEGLQNNRNQATRIFEQLSVRLPEGALLKTIKQQGATITVTGLAQNNSVVSSLMSNVEKSDWFKNPVLVEIKSTDVKSPNGAVMKGSEFSLSFTYVNPEEIVVKDGKTTAVNKVDTSVASVKGK